MQRLRRQLIERAEQGVFTDRLADSVRLMYHFSLYVRQIVFTPYPLIPRLLRQQGDQAAVGVIEMRNGLLIKQLLDIKPLAHETAINLDSL